MKTLTPKQVRYAALDAMDFICSTLEAADLPAAEDYKETINILLRVGRGELPKSWQKRKQSNC